MMELNVNGKPQTVDAAPNTPLLYVLRDHLAMNGAKFGCGLGQCGACTASGNGPLWRFRGVHRARLGRTSSTVWCES